MKYLYHCELNRLSPELGNRRSAIFGASARLVPDIVYMAIGNETTAILEPLEYHDHLPAGQSALAGDMPALSNTLWYSRVLNKVHWNAKDDILAAQEPLETFADAVWWEGVEGPGVSAEGGGWAVPTRAELDALRVGAASCLSRLCLQLSASRFD